MIKTCYTRYGSGSILDRLLINRVIPKKERNYPTLEKKVDGIMKKKHFFSVRLAFLSGWMIVRNGFIPPMCQSFGLLPRLRRFIYHPGTTTTTNNINNVAPFADKNNDNNHDNRNNNHRHRPVLMMAAGRRRTTSYQGGGGSSNNNNAGGQSRRHNNHRRPRRRNTRRDPPPPIPPPGSPGRGRFRSLVAGAGTGVWVVEKQNQRSGRETRGTVQRPLTRSPYHPRGIKVLLESGIVGRVTRLIEDDGIVDNNNNNNNNKPVDNNNNNGSVEQQQQPKCIPCESLDASSLLDFEELEERVKSSLPLWNVKKKPNHSATTTTTIVLSRTFTAKNFRAALDCVNAMGEIAERENHHPDFHLTSYRNVEIALYTHSVGGVTENDLVLAKMFDDEVGIEYSPKWFRENIHPDGPKNTHKQ